MTDEEILHMEVVTDSPEDQSTIANLAWNALKAREHFDWQFRERAETAGKEIDQQVLDKAAFHAAVFTYIELDKRIEAIFKAKGEAYDSFLERAFERCEDTEATQ